MAFRSSIRDIDGHSLAFCFFLPAVGLSKASVESLSC